MSSLGDNPKLIKPDNFIFEEMHVEQTWNYLEAKFGFDKKKWKAKFEEFRKEMKVQRKDLDTDIVSVFFRFGNLYINPVLNQILLRYQVHPTFNKLLSYIVTKQSQK